MVTSEALSPAEEAMMRECFRVTMLRAATIIDGITNNDVCDAQAVLFHGGCTLQQVAKIDRAFLASAHLRACAEGIAEDDRARAMALVKAVRGH
jgi:hypothetical protein